MIRRPRPLFFQDGVIKVIYSLGLYSQSASWMMMTMDLPDLLEPSTNGCSLSLVFA